MIFPKEKKDNCTSWMYNQDVSNAIKKFVKVKSNSKYYSTYLKRLIIN